MNSIELIAIIFQLNSVKSGGKAYEIHTSNIFDLKFSLIMMESKVVKSINLGFIMKNSTFLSSMLSCFGN